MLHIGMPCGFHKAGIGLRGLAIAKRVSKVTHGGIGFTVAGGGGIRDVAHGSIFHAASLHFCKVGRKELDGKKASIPFVPLHQIFRVCKATRLIGEGGVHFCNRHMGCKIFGDSFPRNTHRIDLFGW